MLWPYVEKLQCEYNIRRISRVCTLSLVYRLHLRASCASVTLSRSRFDAYVCGSFHCVLFCTLSLYHTWLCIFRITSSFLRAMAIHCRVWHARARMFALGSRSSCGEGSQCALSGLWVRHRERRKRAPPQRPRATLRQRSTPDHQPSAISTLTPYTCSRSRTHPIPPVSVHAQARLVLTSHLSHFTQNTEHKKI